MKCKRCGEDASEAVTVRIAGKSRRVCEECAEAVLAEEELEASAEAAMQGMMEYGGRR